MPTRSRPPKPPKPPARKTAGAKAAASRRAAPKKPAPRKPRAAAARPAPAPPAATPATTPAAVPAAGAPGAPRRFTPAVRRTCYEVRLLVCPRDPKTCPETWPVGERVLCGSPEMLARFEKAGGAEDLDAEAGYADALSGLTIRNRPDEDLDERDRGDEDEGAEEE